MATALDRALPPVAARLIAQFGKSITLIYPGAGPVYDPETGTTIEGPPVEVETKGIVEEYPAMLTLAGQSSADGIRRGDRKLTIAARGLPGPPTPECTVRIDGLVYQVVQVDATYTGELVGLYTLQIRR